ncbi:hypothetical protein [Vibrio rarus]|uniref:hypothetical protein n=1 Tax=Vibrio rarus TaxID=413403 RepID=UPI0021C39CDE|nr:hypothetical protein [Vibrio rarus]
MRLFLFILTLVHSNVFASPAEKPLTPDSELSRAKSTQVEDTTSQKSKNDISSQVEDKNPSSKEKKETEGFISFSDMIAILAVILSSGSMLYTYSIDSINRKASIHDEYWMREVIYPIFMQSFIEFIKRSPNEFRASQGDMPLFVECYALDELNKIRDNTIFLYTIDKSFPEKAEKFIDDFEDALGEVSDYLGFKEALAMVSRDIITLLKSAQEKV